MKKTALWTIAAFASLVLVGCKSNEGGAGNEYNSSTGTSTQPGYSQPNNNNYNNYSPATNHSSEANMPASTNEAPANAYPTPAPGRPAEPAGQ